MLACMMFARTSFAAGFVAEPVELGGAVTCVDVFGDAATFVETLETLVDPPSRRERGAWASFAAVSPKPGGGGRSDVV